MSPSLRQTTEDAPAVAIPQHSRTRILAIDYGRRKIGLAISDPLALIARPLATLERTNRREDLRRLREICAEHQVGRILVGHPLRLSGEAGDMAREAAQFAARLKKAAGIEVELVDERLTSWEAAETLPAAKRLARARGQRRRGGDGRRSSSTGSARGPAIDPLAAAILLREYLDRMQSRSASSPAERA